MTTAVFNYSITSTKKCICNIPKLILLLNTVQVKFIGIKEIENNQQQQKLPDTFKASNLTRLIHFCIFISILTKLFLTFFFFDNYTFALKNKSQITN